MIVGGFSAKEGAPGPYGVNLPAEVRMERVLRAGPDGARRGEERWTIAEGEGGERVDLRLRYTAAVPSRANPEVRVYSAWNPEFYRIYRVDQGSDALRGAAAGADRVEECAFSAAGGRLGALFDGSERLVGVLSMPWYVRRVFLP
jgi:hypothetical protein